MDRRTFITIAAAMPAWAGVARAFAQQPRKATALPWTQWGGPTRNFHTEAAGIKDV
jgi:hypothetical protein